MTSYLIHTLTTRSSHAHHMHITCTSHAHPMLITCTSHAHHMHITCSSHAHHMHITCTSHAHHMQNDPYRPQYFHHNGNEIGFNHHLHLADITSSDVRKSPHCFSHNVLLLVSKEKFQWRKKAGLHHSLHGSDGEILRSTIGQCSLPISTHLGLGIRSCYNTSQGPQSRELWIREAID